MTATDLPEEDDIAVLSRTGLFDDAWYLQQNQDVAQAAVDPLFHFCRFGWHEGRKPNPYFDPAWYLEQNPDVRTAGLNPLAHYASAGDREGRRPVPHFDPSWFRAAYRLSPEINALAHFLTTRKTGRFAPMAELHAVLHLPPYSNDSFNGNDPFAHYLSDMQQAGQDPFPDYLVLDQSGLLDLNYYLINGSDVHEAKLDPVAHFCHYGWREGRKPNIYFDVAWYLLTNPDVAQLKINPVVHYILQGEPANRRPVPYFDPGWYQATYKLEPGQNALAHFLQHRRSQAFSPNPMFDIRWYVEQNAAELGKNRDPFAHYLQAGTYRPLDPSPDFDAESYRRRHMGRQTRQFRHLLHPDRDNPLVHFLRSQYR